MMAPNLPPQQVVVVSQAMGPSNWSTGLCDCGEDCGSFMLACCCPCIQYGINMDLLTKAGSCAPAISYCLLQWLGCRCFLGGSERGQVRAKYNIPGGGCEDCCMHCWCVPCAFSQEYRELMKREVTNQQSTTVVIQQQQPMNYAPVQQNF